MKDIKPVQPLDPNNPADVEQTQRELLEKFGNWKRDRWSYDIQNILNIALYTGRQYVQWSDSDGRLVPIAKKYSNQMRVVINRIQPKCRTSIATMVQNMPSAEVAPASGDYQDEYGARCAKALLQWDYRNNELVDLYRDAATWAVVCGNSWLKDVWDSSMGPVVPDQVENQPVMEEGQDESGNPVQIPSTDPLTGQPAMQQVVKSYKNEGRARKMVVSPFSIFYDLSYSRWKDVIDCFHREYMPVDWIRQNIPNCEDVTEETALPIDDAYMMMYENIAAGGARKTKQTSAAVLEYWSKATPRFPQGVRITIVNDKIRNIETQEMEALKGEELPFSCIGYIQIPGAIRGMGLPEVLCDAQMVYNRGRSLILENAVLMCQLKWLKRKGTNLTEPINNEIGQIIEYDTEMPTQAQVQPIPQSLYQMAEQCKDDFDTVSMHNRIAEGGSLPAVNSADQVEALTQNDKFAQGPLVDGFLSAIAKSCRRTLLYYQAFGPDEMLLRIVGSDGKVSIQPFRKSDIKENTDVYLSPASMMHQSRSSRTKEIQSILSSPMLQFAPPETQEALWGLALKHLQNGESDQVLNEVTSQESAAERENQHMSNGGQVQMTMWDDHKIHAKVHELRLNSSEYIDYTPEIQMAIKQHWLEHMRILDPMLDYKLSVEEAKANGLPPPPPPQMPMMPPGGAPPPSAGKPPAQPAPPAPPQGADQNA